jgi:hypothetical protein
MALTGHLSDLSLSELIEFFCNQRKTGCLNVLYPQGHGAFYLQSGSVVDAQIGLLRGIDAVYYALTLPNAAFEFNGSAETTERTINQPWTQVVLEGLRRLDEGITPQNAFPESAKGADAENEDQPRAKAAAFSASVPSFLSSDSSSAVGRRKPLIIAAVAVAILLSVVAIGVPAGWYRKAKPAPVVSQPVAEIPNPTQPGDPEPSSSAAPSPEIDPHAADAAALAAKRQRDKERAAKAREERLNGEAPAAASGPKRITVQVTYDESGRVVQASGSDPTAVRIARQKHFPPGKAGSATITIPMN